eukprot:CAMPEP_0173386594 /NCGR_PEP_ID=MMETSP1356-20130122/9185_1 /TAXON_ID=77927 ORGANISM="Hemiselmis virescens, Strain PCC157" /NCGR_SAMPLE_ID=MMETSP1356 /ASSEMBLY_ACC=CAM_ASM_000847 /LENGTH=284 /DNA_ID=CAMNT_0014342887 /DNA_START=102 /DNA_END=953 /DNA_ORIENTATION=-
MGSSCSTAANVVMPAAKHNMQWALSMHETSLENTPRERIMVDSNSKKSQKELQVRAKLAEMELIGRLKSESNQEPQPSRRRRRKSGGHEQQADESMDDGSLGEEAPQARDSEGPGTDSDSDAEGEGGGKEDAAFRRILSKKETFDLQSKFEQAVQKRHAEAEAHKAAAQEEQPAAQRLTEDSAAEWGMDRKPGGRSQSPLGPQMGSVRRREFGMGSPLPGASPSSSRKNSPASRGAASPDGQDRWSRSSPPRQEPSRDGGGEAVWQQSEAMSLDEVEAMRKRVG